MNKATQPIRDAKKVNELLAYLRGKSERDFMIAKMQLNTARRISDIVRLKVSDFVYPNRKLREHLTITEQKTQKEARIVPVSYTHLVYQKHFNGQKPKPCKTDELYDVREKYYHTQEDEHAYKERGPRW